jgi:hypothetical protein
MITRILATATFLILLTQPLFAGTLAEVKLAPIAHLEATLVVAGTDGVETVYTPAQLEKFPTYSLTTPTPWRDEAAIFEGVLLGDILASGGLDKIDAVTVLAENDYKTVLPRELWEDVKILVATRINGGPISRRERGPFLFVIDMESLNKSELATSAHLVWMASRIEPEG